MTNVGIFTLNVFWSSVEILNALSHQGEAVGCSITRQSAVRVSQRGKQNTRYVKEPAMFTTVSQSKKIGKRWLTNVSRKTLTYQLFFFTPFLSQWLKKKKKSKKTEVLSGHLFGSALWWVEKPTTAQNKLGEKVVHTVNQILLNV